MWVWERLLSQYKTHPFTRNFVDGLNLQVSQRDLSRLFVYSSSPHRLLLLICGLHILQFCHVIQFLYLVGLKLCHSTVCSLCSQVGTLQCNISRSSDFCQLFFQILIRNFFVQILLFGDFFRTFEADLGNLSNDPRVDDHYFFFTPPDLASLTH